ncbi:uncharacterized protein TNCV_286101 [Trichonephila clavipes]|nr:uncharacterized protein TNCV_286101 [Trichonephila clavipes]
MKTQSTSKFDCLERSPASSINGRLAPELECITKREESGNRCSRFSVNQGAPRGGLLRYTPTSWSTLCKKSHGIPSSPRAAAVAKFRLLTGHDCLCAHLFRFNLVTLTICVLCDTGQDMTAAHLDECSALNDLNCIVKRYWRARCLMT